MRKALVYSTYKKDTSDFSYSGRLHGFSTEYEELQQGIGQYAVAIIEDENGDLIPEPIRCVRLVKEEQL